MMNKLQEYFEFWLEYAKPEAPDNSIYGSYLFAPTRDDTPEPKEPNTQEEDKLQRALIDYIRLNKKEKLGRYANILLRMSKMGFYQKVLSPLYHPTVYRLLQVQLPQLPQLLGIPKEQVKLYGVTGPGTLNPEGFPVSGWSPEPRNFVNLENIISSGTVLIVFKASVTKNNFFGNPGELAKSLQLTRFIKELETIAVGPVAYDQASYVVFNKAMLEPGVKQQAVDKMLAGIGK